nr:hypothetical protein GCM10020185_39820 [Pseudomonas brassicacearum subsp. brassicacearum]
MNHDVIITCALTGAGDTTAKSPHVPVTPKQIAAAAVEAAKAGATVVHCHVRDPQTGKFSRDVALYREVMERIREADVDIIVNLTAGMGGDLEIGAGERPMEFGPNTDLVGPLTRLAHVEELLPEICTLDCGTLNFGDGDTIYVSTPAQLRAGAKRITELGGQGRAGDLRHRSSVVRQATDQGRPAGKPAVPTLPGHPVGRTGRHHHHESHGRQPAGGRGVGRLRHRPHANADGRPGGAVGRQRAGWAGRQPLAGQRRTRYQRPTGGARWRDPQPPRRPRADPG